MEKLKKSVRSLRNPKSNEPTSRNQYSPVSTGVTDAAVQLWLEFPDDVKYHPSMVQFQEFHENETGDGENLQLNPRNCLLPQQRLPSVNSAPHLNQNRSTGRRDDVNILNVVQKPPVIEEKQEKVSVTAIPQKLSKMAQARKVVKITLLVGVWMFFTVVFLMYNEKQEVTRHTSISPGEIKNYIIQNNESKQSILLKLTGPFMSEQYEKKLNSSEKLNMTTMVIRLEKWVEKSGVHGIAGSSDYDPVQTSEDWIIILESQDRDFHESETRSTVLKLDPLATNRSVLAVRMTTTSNITTPFTLSYTLNPLDGTTGIIYGCILLCALYGLIVFEVIHRTMAALLLSTASLAALALAGERPTVTELITWLDVETLLLLFSMMVIVSLLMETGVFEYFAVLIFQLANGKIWPLITLLCVITAVISLLLDNVTTVMLLTPVTIRLCEVMNLDPVPVLLIMVLFCNLGGTATPVGDPPNVIIASNKQVVQAGINFANFSLHMTFGILLVAVQTYVQLRFITFRDIRKLRLKDSQDIQDLRNQISICRATADSLHHLRPDQLVVRDCLEQQVQELTAKLNLLVKEAKVRACPKDCFESMLADMRKEGKIKDKPLLWMCSAVIAFVVLLFFLRSLPEFNRVSMGWAALLGAEVLLLLADRDLEPLLRKVEWSTLLFFATLFVLMEALSKLGLISYIGGWTESLILRVDESDRLAVALVLMLWISGITSAFVDNVPLTTMMIRVVTSLGTHPTLNLPMAPLIWALSFGVCLGGNGTLIGASSNVVCVGLAEQNGYKISFMQFFKVGFPVMIGHLIVATVYLLISGITSAFVDNVPLTTMMIRVVTSLGTHPTLNLPMAPLIWALSFGVCLGGNGTLIGASSNVVCVGLAEQNGYKISFMQFFKVGFPVMIGHLIVATVYLLISGITSAFVDNVPLTTMMIRVVTSLGTHPTLNLPMAPLIWALSFGVCLGGNGTLIGASSNVVCVGLAEQNGYKISFMQFFKVGFPVMIGHLIVATVYLLVCHCVFEWH